MKTDMKLRRLRVLIDRINKNLDDIEDFDMAALAPWWPTLEARALAITEDLPILLGLAAEVQPVMAREILSLKEAVVNMRIDSYNRMNDITASMAAGEPVHQEPEVCEAMKARGISDHKTECAQDFCLEECPYQARCLASEPAGGEN